MYPSEKPHSQQSYFIMEDEEAYVYCMEFKTLPNVNVAQRSFRFSKTSCSSVTLNIQVKKVFFKCIRELMMWKKEEKNNEYLLITGNVYYSMYMWILWFTLCKQSFDVKNKPKSSSKPLYTDGKNIN